MPEAKYAIGLFFDVEGNFMEYRSFTPPFPPHYRFAMLSDLENLIISGLSEDELDEEMYNQMKVRNFRLEYYRQTGVTLFGYYFEVDE